MQKYTLDTNCIIDVEEKRPAAQYVDMLISLHRRRLIDVSFVAVSASERQPGDRYMEHYDEFASRLECLGLGDIPQLPCMAFCDIGFYGRGYYGGDDAMSRLDRKIHETLFPTIDYCLDDYVARFSDGNEGFLTRARRKWRNAFCDRQMFWAHVHHERDIFISSDKNFKKLDAIDFYPGGTVQKPEEAARITLAAAKEGRATRSAPVPSARSCCRRDR